MTTQDQGAAGKDGAASQALKHESQPLPSHSGKHCSIFIQEPVDLVCFFGTINKKKQTFPVFLMFTYQSGNLLTVQ